MLMMEAVPGAALEKELVEAGQHLARRLLPSSRPPGPLPAVQQLAAAAP